ncbi:MAG: Lrp/AsnC family transcriptional regulator [Chthoniobacterales bacterium]|nr:Lrp/AsnC family transcriptional regulator [Chthoniobacterales bacterium]
MDPLLTILQKEARTSLPDLARQLSLSEEEVAEKMHHFENSGAILGYHAVLDRDLLEPNAVRAAIEVKITPERNGGFDRLANRIAQFEEVQSVYLMSGGYDLLVVINGRSLRDVAAFVANKLSNLEGIQACETRFRLKTYKEEGLIYPLKEPPEQLSVTP